MYIYVNFFSSFHLYVTEHRNMPLDDAIALIKRSFESYVQTLREKNTPPAAAAPPPTPPAPRYPSLGFTPPDSDLTYLLNLLADKRQLTLDEIDKVMDYMKVRRNQQMESEGGAAPPANAQPSTCMLS